MTTRGDWDAFLDALLTFWGAVSDLVQRQEHGVGRKGRRSPGRMPGGSSSRPPS